jgi:hypothetical protein
MKLRISTTVVLLTTMLIVANAQDYSRLEKIELNGKEACTENEKLVTQCSDYILKSPINLVEKDDNRIKAVKFILRWMEATPDYSFSLDETMDKATSSNPSLLGVLLASMAKYAIENKNNDMDDIKYNSFITFIKYLEEPNNKVKLDDDLKDLIKAKHENNLREYLQIESNAVNT